LYLPDAYKYDSSGRRRKPKKPKGEVYAKYEKPTFKPNDKPIFSSYAESRLAESKQYPSRHDYRPTSTAGRRSESKQYTGDYVIGIATLHKSNAVPVTNQKYAEEISAMIK
jgi:hypothetical protein